MVLYLFVFINLFIYFCIFGEYIEIMLGGVFFIIKLLKCFSFVKFFFLGFWGWGNMVNFFI